MRPSRLSRVVRGGIAASVATFAALLSHVAAGGDVPGWLGIAVPLVLSVFVCTALTGRRLSLVRLALAVTLSQLLFHTLFVVGAVTPSGLTHVHHMHLPMDAGATTVAIGADPLMWAMHGLAALVTVIAVHRGEHAARRLLAIAADVARWARRRILAAVLALGALDRPVLPSVSAAAPVLRSVVLRVAAGRAPPRALTI
ncbi:hypothetical protein KZX37_09110 [Microbacterium sp. EYE_5]|uniref:hypothetical protein n=1 Tax=unclassified Microbacterium TaxID=2609290 RepID=UPI002003DF81|nr:MULTISPECIES: hypothetical protein [unclassified Microbacterium]MCK6081326.1 hypothetical protein [Microbacterium sp. EYE_382]MCK6086596.1 hypothetical protein [Microbacterium sp. EYE_384]MCK6123906.1 hypothetical protein [Microbacterium sp. EYE_80]MCK6126815.1 hypothetical protein [Microbacterium sp. EYE_79]MCK6142281.1 hypothetical protein [Microbacterium sp. EYE_39]